MLIETAGKHPAPFTESIIGVLADLIPEHLPAGSGVHDPFAGEGTRLAALCDRLGYQFTGTDLEAWQDRDGRVTVGNSTHPGSYPPHPHMVVTSPTYNNGVNDHFQPRDLSTRLTYRIRAGHPLHDDNTGRWSGRGSVTAERRYWQVTDRVVACWPNTVIVNVKDSPRGDSMYPLTDLWVAQLAAHSYRLVDQVDVTCPGWRVGRNGEKRADTEAVLVARR